MVAPTGTGADFVALPLVFVVVLLASAVWQLDALSKYAAVSQALVHAGAGGDTTTPVGDDAPDGEPTSAPWLAPRLEMGCHIATCIAMAYVLVLMF